MQSTGVCPNGVQTVNYKFSLPSHTRCKLSGLFRQLQVDFWSILSKYFDKTNCTAFFVLLNCINKIVLTVSRINNSGTKRQETSACSPFGVVISDIISIWLVHWTKSNDIVGQVWWTAHSHNLIQALYLLNKNGVQLISWLPCPPYWWPSATYE